MVASKQNRIVLMPTTTITTAVSIVTVGAPFILDPDTYKLELQCVFAVGTDGTSAKAYVQTTVDGTNWSDIASFAFANTPLVKMAAVDSALAHTHATATDGTLTDNTVVNGFIGSKLRVKYVTVGTYSGGTTLGISALPKTNKR